MHTIFPSGSETALDKDAIAKVEELLQTRFFNISTFLKSEDNQRTFENLLKNHSIIVANHMDGSAYDYKNYPLSVLPQLEMFIVEKDGDPFLEFKVNNEKHEVSYNDWPDYSGTFVEINNHLTDFEFTDLIVSYVENNAKHGDDIWFLVPSKLKADELCSIIGYSATRPLEGKYSLPK